jgi:hypothetical protein
MQIIIQSRLNHPLRLWELTVLSSQRAEVYGESKAGLEDETFLGLLLCLVTAPQYECLQYQMWGYGGVEITDE